MDNQHAESSCPTNIIKDTLNSIIVLNDAICVNQAILNSKARADTSTVGTCIVDQDLFYRTKPVLILLELCTMSHQHFILLY